MSTWLGTAVASGEDSKQTAIQVTEQAIAKMGRPEHLKLLIVHAWPHYDLQAVVAGVRQIGGDTPLIGCTSSGEFTESDLIVGGIAVTAIGSDHMQVKVGYAENFADNLQASVTRVLKDFSNAIEAGFQGRTFLLYTDALAGHGEALIDELMLQSHMQYQLFGAAAADDVTFQKTQIFVNDRVLSNAFVCAEVLSEKPFSIVARHGWTPVEGPYRVTRAEGAVLHELNGKPAWDIYRQFAAKHGIDIPADGESSFLMQNILGIESQGCHKLRVPLALNADGSLACAAELHEGELVFIMNRQDTAVLDGGKRALAQAKQQTKTDQFAGALVCECVATRLQLGDEFFTEIQATASQLDPMRVMGLASYGQLARADGEFTGLSCATSLVCLVPN